MNYQDLTPNSYLITMPTEGAYCVHLVSTKYENGKAILWAIRDEYGSAMSKKHGHFVREPLNSSKTTRWFQEFQFKNPQKALDTYFKFYIKAN